MESSVDAQPWLHVVGIGELGMESLLPPARAVVERAEVIIGGSRHPDLGPGVRAERLGWPESFEDLVSLLRRLRPRRPVMLVAGDPLWYSIGARLLRAIPGEEIAFYPQISAFQWAASRMRWSLADVETLTAHGRHAAQIVPWFWPGARLLVLTQGSESPGEIARLLDAAGYGRSRMSVLANLGGPDELRIDGTARAWSDEDPTARMPAFHTLAIAVEGRPPVPLCRLPGLPDSVFAGGLPVIPRPVRAFVLALLMPARGARLWDVGGGNGAAAIEWMRAAPEARATVADGDAAALAAARRNALALGTPRLETRGDGGLPPGDVRPDAILLSRGATHALAEGALGAVGAGGRVVVCARGGGTALLEDLAACHGGECHRLRAGTGGPEEAAVDFAIWSFVR